MPEIDSSKDVYEWTAIAKGIKEMLSHVEDYNLSRFVQLFNTLHSTYSVECKNLLRENRIIINSLTEDICNRIEEDKDVKEELMDLFDITLMENDDTEIDDDADEEILSNELYTEVRGWLKRYCSRRINLNIKVSACDKFVEKLIVPLIGTQSDKDIRKIGELILFERYAKYTNGVDKVLLDGFVGKYKKFRKHLQKKSFVGCNLKLLNELINQREGKELHYQEQTLIMGFINNVIKLIRGYNKSQIKHAYVEAYEELARPIIGVDEVTDFSECDLYAIQSLLTKDFNSLTLCGDMMQRLTDYGISSWDDLIGIVPNPTVVEMKTSYRQSATLLEVAKQMYIDTIGEKPSYKAFFTSKKVPKPLVCVSKVEFDKITWIEKRIAEVYRAYGETLPAIAIFVNDEGQIPRFVKHLSGTSFIASKSIEVVDGVNGIAKGTGNHISVYPIDIVKGMEFDVVFFHNIDNSYVETERLKRYIYVGVSRAAFFLGITLSEKNDEICKYFETDIDWFTI